MLRLLNRGITESGIPTSCPLCCVWSIASEAQPLLCEWERVSLCPGAYGSGDPVRPSPLETPEPRGLALPAGGWSWLQDCPLSPLGALGTVPCSTCPGPGRRRLRCRGVCCPHVSRAGVAVPGLSAGTAWRGAGRVHVPSTGPCQPCSRTSTPRTSSHTAPTSPWLEIKPGLESVSVHLLLFYCQKKQSPVPVPCATCPPCCSVT